MLKKMMIVFIVVLCSAGNLYADNKNIEFQEIAHDGVVTVKQYQKTLVKTVQTEPVPKDIALSKEQKETLWSGGKVKIEKSELFINDIFNPVIKYVKTITHISWSDGAYHIGKNVTAESYDFVFLRNALIILTISLLFVNMVIVFQNKDDYDMKMFVYNLMMLVLIPIGATASGICILISDSVAMSALSFVSGLVGVVLLIISIAVAFVAGFDNDAYGPLADTLWMRLVLGFLSLSVGVILMFIIVPSVYDGNVGVIAQELLYFFGCLVGVPFTCVLAKTTVDAITQKI